MTITVSTTDKRDGKALALFARCAEWQTGHTKDGRPFFYVPGSRGAVYMADATCCTCPDACERACACKHSLAVAQFMDAEATRLGLATDAQVDVIVGSSQPASNPLSCGYSDLFPLCSEAGCRKDALRSGKCLEHRERVAA